MIFMLSASESSGLSAVCNPLVLTGVPNEWRLVVCC